MSDAVGDECILNRIKKVLYVKSHQNSMKADHTALQDDMIMLFLLPKENIW